MRSLAQQEEAVFGRLLDALRERPDVDLVGDPSRRTPTVAFLKRGETPQQTAARLAERGVAVWAGHYYAIELMTLLGLPDGAVRAGIAAYTSDDDVDRLLAAL
jgi:selenocysteine lyase/cysteine desulfurase